MAETQRDPEELAFYGVLLVTMSPVVVAAVIAGAPIGAGATICMLLALLGLLGLLTSSWRRGPKLARARARPSRQRSRSSSRRATR